MGEVWVGAVGAEWMPAVRRASARGEGVSGVGGEGEAQMWWRGRAGRGSVWCVSGECGGSGAGGSECGELGELICRRHCGSVVYTVRVC